jgi:hypothetical protein
MASAEVFVAEAVLVGVVACLVEVVHVQLADEGAEVVVLEELGQDRLRKLVDLLHNKAVALLVPAYY